MSSRVCNGTEVVVILRLETVVGFVQTRLWWW